MVRQLTDEQKNVREGNSVRAKVFRKKDEVLGSLNTKEVLDFLHSLPKETYDQFLEECVYPVKEFMSKLNQNPDDESLLQPATDAIEKYKETYDALHKEHYTE